MNAQQTTALARPCREGHECADSRYRRELTLQNVTVVVTVNIGEE